MPTRREGKPPGESVPAREEPSSFRDGAPPGGSAAEREPGQRRPLLSLLGGSLLARFASAGSAFALTALLARLAGAEQYGTYSYVLACLGVALLFCGLGLDTALVRYVAVYRAQAHWPLLRGLVGWSRRLVLTTSTLVAAVSALVLALGRDRLDASLVHTAWFACGVLPVAALLRLNEARLLGLKRVVLAQLPDGVIRPAITASLAALAFGLSTRPLSSTAAMGLHLIAVSAAAGLSLALERLASRRDPSTRETRRDVRTWLRVSLPIWADIGLRQLSSSLDVILVGAFAGMADAGVYAVASRLAELVVFGAHASQAAARPHIAESHSRADAPTVQRIVTAAAGWSTLFAAAVCCVLIPARSMLLRLFGPEFTAGARVLPILAAGYAVTAGTALVDSVMIMTGRHVASALITTAVVALKLPLMGVALAYGGIAGAALASAAAMIIGRVWGWIYVRRTLDLDGTAFGWLRERRARRTR